MRPNPIGRQLLLIAITGIVLGVFGCCSRPLPVFYYTLDPLPLTRTPTPPPVETPTLRIGVGPVDLPTYLERAQIVTRSGDYTLAINDFHRWAGPLDEEIQRVLVVSMADMLPGAEILSYPWGRRRDPPYQVRLSIQRFDGQKSGSVHLRGIWHLTCFANPENNMSRTFEITEAVLAPTMQAVVAAQNRALSALSGQIVNTAVGMANPIHGH